MFMPKNVRNTQNKLKRHLKTYCKPYTSQPYSKYDPFCFAPYPVYLQKEIENYLHNS